VAISRERVDAAEGLGIGVGTLDSAVKAARPANTKGQGRALIFWAPAPPTFEPFLTPWQI